MVEDHMQPYIQHHLMIIQHLLLELGPFTFQQPLVSQEVQAGEEGMFRLVKLFKVEHSQALMLYQEEITVLTMQGMQGPHEVLQG
jgi:hypothetical protein